MAEYVIQGETLTAIADAIRAKKGGYSDYIQLEYIESTGTQYIDTGYYVTSENLKIVMRFLFKEINAWAAICGVEGTSNKLLALTPMLDASSNLTFYSGYSSQRGAIPVKVNTDYSLTCQTVNGAITYECNGTTGTTTAAGSLCKTDSIYVFTLNSAVDTNTLSQAAKMRLYSMQMYDNNVLVRDFVPCVHADGTVGLYDLVNNVFYTNAGSGTFTAGAEMEAIGGALGLIPTTSMAGEILSIGPKSNPLLQSKEVPAVIGGQTVTADSGYDGLSSVIVGAVKTATQATPAISVSSSGLITASATQTEGYVSAGTKSATKQLTTQGTQTITPGTSNKTIASGRYLTGIQTILGDSNLVAENIKKGVSIFDVIGTLEAGGGSGGGGGLPGGISKIATGTFTPTEDVSSAMVDHGLGEIPTFLVWVAESDLSSPQATFNILGAIVRKVHAINSSTNHNNGYFFRGYNASKSMAGAQNGSYSTTYMSATQCRLCGNSTYPLSAGHTYRWVAGVIDGIA